ncbi:MAG: DUF6155 family protein [Duncaniella sp.]|nr:DUF6155 family protein [Muribaculum sp.]MCM1254911.1 DUF6155 family protein [Duncaniella sp.]
MSKATVRKAIAGFEASELKELIIDVYSKSKEAKELLDFFANPDISAKIDEYKKPILKEIHRYTRHNHHPRMPKIRAMLKKFSILEPGDEAIAELRAYIVLEFCKLGSETSLQASVEEAVDKFFRETLMFMKKRGLLDDYERQFRKSIESMRDRIFFKNQLKKYLLYTLNHFEDDEEE